ncbi:death-associated protein 1-like [Physella acuta]|uniref:death-associated protein 1-like n=1 Tax=Physella acuta TaxID=109671 RepID=UPI0027DDCE73|nr:death-associated protein 1-like [Physella acuta]
MADDAAVVDLKAGHPPAVKVGGMRVVQHKKEGDKNEPPTMTPEEEAEFGSSPPKTDKHHQSLLISGVVTKGDKDFTPQAVKSFHEKPLPQHDVRPRPTQHSMKIQQPK